ncbi:MAG: hypothetical protein Kow0077_13590 [Anaerolineae bacterium]
MLQHIASDRGIRLFWDAECRILLVRFNRGWNPAAYEPMVRRANALVQSQPGDVSVILYSRNSGLVPPVDIFDLGRKTIRQVPANVRRVVIVDPRNSTRLLIKGFDRLLSFQGKGQAVQFFTANSISEAYSLLQGPPAAAAGGAAK